MHIDDLRVLAPLWLSKTEEVRQDTAHWATNITGDVYGKGWISEMYGYSFGAAEVNSSPPTFLNSLPHALTMTVFTTFDFDCKTLVILFLFHRQDLSTRLTTT